jgi:hypothetical protein
VLVALSQLDKRTALEDVGVSHGIFDDEWNTPSSAAAITEVIATEAASVAARRAK